MPTVWPDALPTIPEFVSLNACKQPLGPNDVPNDTVYADEQGGWAKG